MNEKQKVLRLIEAMQQKEKRRQPAVVRGRRPEDHGQQPDR